MQKRCVEIKQNIKTDASFKRLTADDSIAARMCWTQISLSNTRSCSGLGHRAVLSFFHFRANANNRARSLAEHNGKEGVAAISASMGSLWPLCGVPSPRLWTTDWNMCVCVYIILLWCGQVGTSYQESKPHRVSFRNFFKGWQNWTSIKFGGLL